VAILRPGGGGLGPIETAKLLRQRLHTHDQFDCHEPSGIPQPGEPNWDYLCLDLSRSERPGYFVKTSDKRISDIAPAG